MTGSDECWIEMARGDETPEGLRAEIEHLRRLARGISDQAVTDAIDKMIEELERRLKELGAS